MTTFMTYNLCDYHRGRTPDELARYRLVEAVIRDAAPDVIAVQELPGRTQQRAEAALLRLADATGMVCRTGRNYAGPVAATPGGHDDLAIGLMWRPGIWAGPHSLTIYKGPDWWHALIHADLRIGNTGWVTHACYHAPPRAGGTRRAAEARQVVEAMVGRRGLVAADWNNPYYYRDRGARILSRPKPSWDTGHGIALDAANRAAAHVLARGGLYDPAVHLDRPRPVTTGHWPRERNGARPIDAILATGHMAVTISECFLIDTDQARSASDHLPVGVRYHPNLISTSKGDDL